MIVNILSNALKYSNPDAEIHLGFQMLQSTEMKKNELFLEKSEQDSQLHLDSLLRHFYTKFQITI